jgi:Zinc finger, C2H2 type
MRPVLSTDKAMVQDAAGVITFSVENKCETCGDQFSSISQLKRHQNSLHYLQKTITCCDQVFSFESEHKKHLKLAHTETVECQQCGKVLKNKKTLLVHMRSHQSVQERKFRCRYPECTKAFNFKLHLQNHERTHSGKLLGRSLQPLLFS